MSDSITCSLIVSTYNWPAALHLVLKSISKQTKMPDSVIVADDGSGKETEAVIQHWRNQLSSELIHVWQPDEGFQVGRIRNKAIAQANGDYIINIDGDMVLHKDFVSDHLNAAKPNCFIQGGRVILNPAITSKALTEEHLNIHLFSKGVSNRKNVLRNQVLSQWILKRESSDIGRVRSCNIAFWKAQLIKVNGFNEDMTGWGREDTELVVRLVNAGYRRSNLKFAGLAYHLYHKQADRDRLSINDQILQQNIDQQCSWCENGLSQYL